MKPFHFGAMGLIGLIGASSAGGRVPTYYFSAAGSDSNNGLTISTPKQTLSAFNGLTLVATDYVAFRSGDTFSGTMTIPGGGSALSRVIIGSYGVGAAPIIAAAANTSGIVATNLSYLTIQNLTITGSGTTTSADGIQINVASGALTDIILDTITASGFSHCGIYVTALGGTATLAYLTIQNCNTFGNGTGVFNGGGGIFVRGPNGVQAAGAYSFTNTLITNCVAHDNLGAAGTAFHTGNGILLTECNVGLITLCTAYNNGGNCNTSSGGPGGIWTADSKAVIINQCESYSNHTSNLDGNGFDMDGGCDNCTIQYCFSHGNDGGGFLNYSYAGTGLTGNTNNTIKFCVSSHDCQKSTTVMGGIYVNFEGGAPNTSLKIYGNTVFTTSPSANAAALKFVGPTGQSNGFVANNIFQSSASAKLLDTATNTVTGINITGNCWWPSNSFNMSWNNTTYTSYAAWQTATGLEKIASVNVGVNANPMICNVSYGGANAQASPSQKNSFKLASGSPCLGSGVNLLTQYSVAATTDYYGNAYPRAGTYDIGCSAGAAVLSGTVTAAFTDHAEDTSSQTTYTWSSRAFAIGTAAADRIVRVAITGRQGSPGTATINSVTIGGVTATLVKEARNTGGSTLYSQSVWQALVPTGTTATVSATFSTAILRASCIVYTIKGADTNTLPQESNVYFLTGTDNTTTNPTVTGVVVVPIQGAAIIFGGCAGISSGSATATPTNYTNDLAATVLGTTSWVTSGKDATAGLHAYSTAWGGTGTNSPVAVMIADMPTIT